MGDLVNKGWVKIFTGPFGSALHKHDYTENGVTVVPAESIVGAALDKSKFNVISLSKAEELDRYRLQANDIVFARRGAQACGLSALVKEEDRAQIAGTGLICLRVVNRRAIDPYFLFLSVSDGKSVAWLKAHAVGATMPNLNGGVLKSLPISLPNMRAQRRVSDLHRPLASKLILNLKINQTLEKIAQAIFKSWFVDFDPVKAKVAALEAGSSEQDALLAAMQAISGKSLKQLQRLKNDNPKQYAKLEATAELFPASMQDSELGEIPEGWGVGKLSDIATFPSNRISTVELSQETYVSTENMLENRRGVCSASSLPSSATVPGFESKQILISNIRPYFKKIWFASHSGGRSPDVLCFESKCQGASEFLYNLLYQDRFFDYMMLTSKGAKMPRGDKKAIMQLMLAVPRVELMQCFSEHVEVFYKLVNSNSLESKLLASTRDTLLPRLLSGELTIPETEEQVAEVADA
ncbi:restriction endonuclease subunit S [Halomonas sp. MCCC 1A11062]|uniref:restriction endonuclease subunit S n=1 Tax=Halomonas sp. MCCC 1A11062 TaxID=2733485 RepID=UPI001F17BDEA|nr:restriction endonuclease subunit S [Halomonas sp. MCCC 1A11062]MCE8039532.1 restriction endonuclease subunit S [Halomonas sp. MCCC 1A11062]